MLRSLLFKFVCYGEYLWKFVGFREMKMLLLTFFSKMYDVDDWGIDDRMFKLFNREWGPFTCDLFANS